MNVLRQLRHRHSLSWLVRGPLPLIVIWAALAPAAFSQGRMSMPSQPYFLALPGFYNGQYLATSQVMATCLQGAYKNPAIGGLWIDSICYETMQGECAFQTGNHLAAQMHYEVVLDLVIRFNDWMRSVQFPPTIVPAQPQYLKPVPWYATTRLTVIGAYPPQMNVLQGNLNNNQAIVEGGIVRQPMLIPVYVQEIVRCSCLAIRRYRELLGPSCPRSSTTQNLVKALSAPLAWPNHWSEAWVETELGLALAAAGRAEQARKTLSHAELASGTFDHGLTGHGLLMRGVLDLESGDYKSAHRYFLEASWAAANFNDFGVVEESLRYAALAHFLSNGRLPYPLLAPAVAWAAAGNLGQLNTSLLLDSAENASLCGLPAPAAGFLGQAAVLAAGSNMLTGKIGARLNYLNALAAYQLGNAPGGDVALTAALAFQAVGSLRLYHIAAVDTLWNTRAATDFSERMAVDLYSLLLRDPTPSDWMIDPLESLTMLCVPHPLSYENWFEAALARRAKGQELALTITDLCRRHRFLTSTLEHGGRLVNLRWLLEAPEQTLDQPARMQRQALLMRFPPYAEKAHRVAKLRRDLRNLPLMTDDQEIAEQQSEMLQELARLSGEQELLLKQMSVGREPANLVFPPVRSFEQVQQSLADGQALLAFFDGSRFTYSFLVEKDKYTYNEVQPTKGFSRNLTSLLQKLGNFGEYKGMKLTELTSDAWQAPARQIVSVLVKNSKADFTKTLNELIIVPDGVLWYVPFEALPVSDDEQQPLINRVRVRYAPTIGLAVGETRHRRRKGNMAVALGKLYPRDEKEVVDREFADLCRSLPDAEAVRGKLPAHGAVFCSLFDRLIVLNEVPPSLGLNWSPLQIDRRMPGGNLSEWMSLPFNGPEQIILPGFRTVAERSLSKKAGLATGHEMFLSVCGLMGSGARTVLISRWRTGGQSSIDLVREFAQELPYTTASDAWQRSVQMLTHAPVSATHEPRLSKLGPQQDPPTGAHPFFWAGYLLVDTGDQPRSDDDDEEEEPIILAEKPQ